MPFAELCITSNFTFLTGGSHPHEYAWRAIELGLPAFAIADRNSVAGIVRAHAALRESEREGTGTSRLLPAARLCLAEGPELTALPRNRAAPAPGRSPRRIPTRTWSPPRATTARTARTSPGWRRSPATSGYRSSPPPSRSCTTPTAAGWSTC
jgi:hypothetical protein